MNESNCQKCNQTDESKREWKYCEPSKIYSSSCEHIYPTRLFKLSHRSHSWCWEIWISKYKYERVCWFVFLSCNEVYGKMFYCVTDWFLSVTNEFDFHLILLLYLKHRPANFKKSASREIADTKSSFPSHSPLFPAPVSFLHLMFHALFKCLILSSKLVFETWWSDENQRKELKA